MLKRYPLLAAFYTCMALFGIFSLAVNLTCWLMGWLLPQTRRRRQLARLLLHYMMRLWMWALRVFCVIRVDWPQIETLRKMQKTILVANHPSLLDICWILAAAPNITCVIKSSIRNNGFYNASARLAGYISNDDGMDGLHQAIDRIADGDILCIFPEGTRTVTRPMNRCKPGFALIARHSGAPIQILYIHSNTKCFTKGKFFRPDVLPIRYSLNLGPRFENVQSGISAANLAHEVETAMRNDLEQSAI